MRFGMRDQAVAADIYDADKSCKPSRTLSVSAM
jgi:hypothetical protein